jgi:hypothetical protein
MHKEASSEDIDVLRALLERLRRMTKETKEQLAGIIQIPANECWTPGAPLEEENSDEASNSETTESPHEHATEQRVDVIERSIEVEDTAEANHGGAEESMAIEPTFSASGGVVDQLTNVDDCGPDVGEIAAIAMQPAKISQPAEALCEAEPVTASRNVDKIAVESVPFSATLVHTTDFNERAFSIENYMKADGAPDLEKVVNAINCEAIPPELRKRLFEESIKRMDNRPKTNDIHEVNNRAEAEYLRNVYRKLPGSPFS